jgi:isopenicillin-N epimerase
MQRSCAPPEVPTPARSGSTDRFGDGRKPEWGLEFSKSFLNHGSYGACPLSLLQRQDVIRALIARDPNSFMHERVMPKGNATPLRDCRKPFAAHLNCRAEELAFCENTTAAVQSVLNAFQFQPLDEILTTSHQYRAVDNAVRRRCQETGAVSRIARLDLAADDDAIVAAIDRQLTAKTRLLIIDHITSQTARLFPVAEIARRLEGSGVRIFVDGAHALGQVPIDLKAIDVDWYVTNVHKWAFGPPGCAILFAADRVQPTTRHALSSYFAGDDWRDTFDYVGSRDYSPWFVAPDALAFARGLFDEGLAAHVATLMDTARQGLEALGCRPIGPSNAPLLMQSFALPSRVLASDGGAAELTGRLWRDHQIQAKVYAFDGKWIVRICGQAYVSRREVERFVEVLDTIGWPGRAGA